jgi:hypothetical protein
MNSHTHDEKRAHEHRTMRPDSFASPPTRRLIRSVIRLSRAGIRRVPRRHYPPTEQLMLGEQPILEDRR